MCTGAGGGSGSTKFRKGLGGFGAEPVHVQQGSGEGYGEDPEKVLEKVPGGVGVEPGQVQQGSGKGSGEGLRGLSTHRIQAEVYRGCFAVRFRKTCKNTTFRLLGIAPKLIISQQRKLMGP